MTEKEKMLLGLLYDANYDKHLIEERNLCKKLCYDYNQLRPSDNVKKENIIRKLFWKTRNNFTIEPHFWCDYGYNIEIGENFYVNHNTVSI